MSQGLPNPWFRSTKVQNEDFLKKTLRDLKKKIVLGSYDSLASFFAIKKTIQTECNATVIM